MLYLDSGPGLAREIDRRTEGIECYTTGLLPEQPGRLAGRLFSRVDNGAGCCQHTLTGSPAGSLLECLLEWTMARALGPAVTVCHC